MRVQFVTVNEVQSVLGVSRSKAYQIIQTLNKELKADGYMTIAGKCPVRYFLRKFYGLQIDGYENTSEEKGKRPPGKRLVAQTKGDPAQLQVV